MYYIKKKLVRIPMTCVLAVIVSVILTALVAYLLFYLCVQRKKSGRSTESKKGSDPVVVVEGIIEVKGKKHFDEIVSQQQKVIVMFWAPWCGHCRATKPKFIEAAKKIHESGNAVVIMVNGDQQENRSLMKEFGIRGFPTILKLQKESDKPDTYSGNRSVDSFVSFAQ